jgi:hypothetical protein
VARTFGDGFRSCNRTADFVSAGDDVSARFAVYLVWGGGGVNSIDERGCVSDVVSAIQAEHPCMIMGMKLDQLQWIGLYGWIPNNAGFGFLDLAPSILHSNWFLDYIS